MSTFLVSYERVEVWMKKNGKITSEKITASFRYCVVGRYGIYSC